MLNNVKQTHGRSYVPRNSIIFFIIIFINILRIAALYSKPNAPPPPQSTQRPAFSFVRWDPYHSIRIYNFMGI